MASSTFNIHQSAPKEQPYLSEVRPRHPYAFCQCEGDGCSECMQEKEQIGKLLLELAALRKRRNSCGHSLSDFVTTKQGAR